MQSKIQILAQGYRGSGQAMPSLEDLYAQAVAMTPEITQAEQEKAEEQRRKEAAERAKRARSAGSRPKDSAATGGEPAKRSLKEDLAAGYDEQVGV